MREGGRKGMDGERNKEEGRKEGRYLVRERRTEEEGTPDKPECLSAGFMFSQRFQDITTLTTFTIILAQGSKFLDYDHPRGSWVGYA